MYAPNRVDRGRQPRNLVDYRTARERFGVSREVGEAFENEIGYALELQPERGWGSHIYYDTDHGARFHDHAAKLKVRVAIEVKSGESAEDTVDRQLEKDTVLLRRDGVMVWLVEDLAKLPPAALERARDLERAYPDTFLLRVVTDLSRDRVLDEVRVQLRTRELEPVVDRQRDLARQVAIERRDPTRHQERPLSAETELARVTEQRAAIEAALAAVQQRVDMRAAHLAGEMERASRAYAERTDALERAASGVDAARARCESVILNGSTQTDELAGRIDERIERDQPVGALLVELVSRHEQVGRLRENRDLLGRVQERLSREIVPRTGPPGRDEVNADLDRRDWWQRTTGSSEPAQPRPTMGQWVRGDPVVLASEVIHRLGRDLEQQNARNPLSHNDITASVRLFRAAGLEPAQVRERVVGDVIQQRSDVTRASQGPTGVAYRVRAAITQQTRDGRHGIER
ncbi:hypothetical protein VV02_03405 [Luteipulveratus mongoliensis]|uniref:Uncharacterized protein n=1 Tax=Luteipulveratus mongoliensis TaxID=571913 RepID=A0A0K1JEK5_9MICO|nr:hypothetical protein VV02_03405 [Luteipulveratus mongoliensis]